MNLNIKNLYIFFIYIHKLLDSYFNIIIILLRKYPTLWHKIYKGIGSSEKKYKITLIL